MSRKTKIILFSVLSILFFTTAPLAVLHSQGYRFDFESKRFVQVGGLFLKISPPSAEIYIDQVLVKRTNFLLDSVLIQNLLPKKYQVEIKKEGYFSWDKALSVNKKQVTEVKNVTLIPKEPGVNVLISNVENIWLLPNGRKIILKEKDEDGWSLKLFNLDKKIKSHLIKEKEVSRFESELLDLSLSGDSKRILLKLGLKEQIKYFVIDLSRPTPSLISLDFLPLTAEAASFDPENSLKILFLDDQDLYQTDLTVRQISLLLEDVLIYQAAAKDLYYLDHSGNLFIADLFGRDAIKLSGPSFSLKKEVRHNLEVLADSIFLKEEKTVYYFDLSEQSFIELAESADSLNLSPDGKKIAYTDNNELWLFFLEDINDQPVREAKSSLFLTRFSEEIEQIFWLNSYYLIFKNNGSVKFAEIDNRDKINIYDLAVSENFKFIFNSVDKKLYLLDESDLYQSKQIVK